MLGEGDFDDLDEGIETQDFAGYHSYRHGPGAGALGPPIEEGTDRRARRPRSTQWVADGVDEEEIGVAARTKSSFDAIERALGDAGRQVCILPADLPRADRGAGRDHAPDEGPRVQADGPRRRRRRDDSDRRMRSPTQRPTRCSTEVDLQREQCLLYVAATRARDELWVGWSGKPSRFLGAVGVENGSDD